MPDLIVPALLPPLESMYANEDISVLGEGVHSCVGLPALPDADRSPEYDAKHVVPNFTPLLAHVPPPRGQSLPLTINSTMLTEYTAVLYPSCLTIGQPIMMQSMLCPASSLCVLLKYMLMKHTV